MSVSKDLRRWLINDVGVTIRQIEEGNVNELACPDDGLIWYGRSGTERARTMCGEGRDYPEEQQYAVEIYHPDMDVVESNTILLHNHDQYRGVFGNGYVQCLQVDNQSDEYVPRMRFTDEVALNAAFLSINLRLYRDVATYV